MLIEFIKERSELYHVSPVKNKKSILSTGLRGPVYLTPDYEYIIGDDPDFRHDLSVFLVNVEGLELEEDPEYSDTYGSEEDESVAYICRDSISPDRITYLGNLKLTEVPIDKSKFPNSPFNYYYDFVKSIGFKDHELKDGEWEQTTIC